MTARAGAGRRTPVPAAPAGAAARALAIRALVEVEEGGRANLVVPRLLAGSRLAERDRAFVTELVYGTVRMRRACDWLVDPHVRRRLDPDVRAALRLGAYQLAWLGTPVHAAVSATVDALGGPGRGLANAVLRRVAEQIAAGGPDWPDDATRLSYPDWIMARLTADLGAGPALDALAQMNEPASATVRADGYIQDEASRWVAEAVGAQPGERVADLCAAPGGKATWMAYGPQWPDGGRADLDDRSAGEPASDRPDGGRPDLDDRSSGEPASDRPDGGRPGLDDRSSGEPASDGPDRGLAGPFERGTRKPAPDGDDGRQGEGQERLMAPAGGPRLVLAGDLDPVRAGVVAANAARLGLANVATVVADALRPPVAPGAFDRVLVDAPCSGLGVLRRRPDARWRIQPADLPRLAGLQRRLLDAALPLVAPGGLVVYSVCTLSLAETAGIDRWLSEAHPEARPVPPPGAPWERVGRGARLLPQTAGTDGMFVLMLQVDAPASGRRRAAAG